MLGRITLLGLSDLELAGQSLSFSHRQLVALRQARDLLLQGGGLFGLFFLFRFQCVQFFFRHHDFGRAALQLLAQRLDIRLRRRELLLKICLLLLESLGFRLFGLEGLLESLGLGLFGLQRLLHRLDLLLALTRFRAGFGQFAQ